MELVHLIRVILLELRLLKRLHRAYPGLILGQQVRKEALVSELKLDKMPSLKMRSVKD